MKKIIKKLSSIKMAVVSISMIAVLTAVGTIIESKYDAQAAQKLVYQSIWMQIVMGIFAINLIAVIVDRFPWKLRHLSFICAHIGILLILAGQYLSNNYGLDGSLRVGVGESNRFVIVPSKTDLSVYSSFDGTSYTKLYEREVDFFLNPPSVNQPVMIPVDQSDIKITGYKKYVIPSKKVLPSEQKQVGAGLRFQIHNDRVNVVEWLVQRNPNHVATHDFGPAQIHLGVIPTQGHGVNEIYLEPTNDPEKIKYAVFHKDKLTPSIHGIVAEGGVIQTGWMALEVKVLRFYPKAVESWELTEKDRPTPMTTAAARVEFQGQEQWILLNDTLKLFTNSVAYIVTYTNRRIDLGFPVSLDKFIIDRYPGTMRAASYKSHVIVPELGGAEISMNEPLKYKGLTIYQASFEDGPRGAPTASVFSINHDPGRSLKYLGSLIMTLGIVLLFYFKKRSQTSARKG